MFDVIVCSAEVGIKKPSRQVFDLTMAQLGSTRDTTIYIDDDMNNVNAMQKHRLRSIHFRSVAQVKRELGKLLPLNASRARRISLEYAGSEA